MIKQIDRLLFKAFLPPFFLSFFVALFVLIMQTLWSIVDKIMGKGVGLGMLLELLGYMCLSLFPLALPIGILIASVMVFGNLSERYELVAMKSAGVSLVRIMLPTMIIALIASFLSLTCSNYIIPIANLKYRTRLLDIRRNKPALSIQEKSFNDDFAGVTLYVENKSDDGKDLDGVLIYDHKRDQSGRLTSVMAERGRMTSTSDGRAMVLALHNGQQLIEYASDKNRTLPFVKMDFREHERIFDLTQFDMEQSDEERYKSHQSMLSLSQLEVAIDSIKAQNLRVIDGEAKATIYGDLRVPNKPYSQANSDMDFIPDSAVLADKNRPFLEAFSPHNRRRLATLSAQKAANSVKRISRLIDKREGGRKRLDKHRYEYHIKFASALVCLVFLFIGAPMGAIIRKGGYGYPLIITILFFMVYMILTISFKETMKVGGIDPLRAAWIPVWVLIPIGTLLTYMALNNIKAIPMEHMKRIFRRKSA